MDGSKLHVAMLSSPGMGHLIPSLLLANRLATHHDVHVTVLALSTSTSTSTASVEHQILQSLSAQNHVKIIRIPSPDISVLVDVNTKVSTRLCMIMREAQPSIRSAISDMNPPANVFIADCFGTEAWPIAEEFGIPKYVYIISNAWYVALTTYCPVLDKEVNDQYVDLKEPLKIPGCKSVRPEDVIEPMLNREDQQYREYLRRGIECTLADGILMNTWEDLESGTLRALRNNEIMRKVVKAPVYPIGPLCRQFEQDSSKRYIIEWLDKQPVESVLFVSFGSGGALSYRQTTELAWGLELSQQRFVWVVRPPTNERPDGSFFTPGSGPDGMPDCLPDGFMMRIRKVGLVVPLWAPQVQILNHPSVGGFLSHCGWNSTMESIAGGVPIIAWPLYAEQRMNATMLTEELKVAVRPEVLPTKKTVERIEIEKMVRTLMQYKEGKAMRERVKELKISGEKALNEGGCSYNSMCKVIKECESKLRSRRNINI